VKIITVLFSPPICYLVTLGPEHHSQSPTVYAEPPRVSSGPCAKLFSLPPPRTDRLKKTLTLTRKDRLSVAEWFGLVLKGLICTIDRLYKERQKHMQQVVPGPPVISADTLPQHWIYAAVMWEAKFRTHIKQDSFLQQSHNG